MPTQALYGGRGLSLMLATRAARAMSFAACLWPVLVGSYFVPHIFATEFLGRLWHTSPQLTAVGGAASGGESEEATWYGGTAGAARLHDINGAHFVHFICVICQPKCVAFSLLIYRGRTGYI